VDKKSKRVIGTAFADGKQHDFRLYKESKVRVKSETEIGADSGYQGIAKLYAESALPKKRTMKNPLGKRLTALFQGSGY
jgi:hypothetical protein